MEYIKVEESFPRLSGTAVTLGKFDGVHRGHRKLIETILSMKEQDLKTVLLAIDVSDRLILTHEERASLLEKLGIDILIECPLSERIRKTKAENFIREILIGALGTRFTAVGEDYRFGFERKGNGALLKEAGKKYGFGVEIVSHEMDGRRKISSTYIREELQHGKMEKTAFLMGTPYFASGRVVHGRGLGHKKLLPTVNVIPPAQKLLPPNGVYATRVHFGDTVWNGISNIGTKPTVGESFTGIETYLLDCGEDLYDRECTIEFLHFTRPEKKFSSLDSLRTQLADDERAAREFFSMMQGSRP